MGWVISVVILLAMLFCIAWAAWIAISEWKNSAVRKAATKESKEGYELGIRDIQREAITRGFAYRDPQHGNFVWGESRPKPKLIFPVADEPKKAD